MNEIYKNIFEVAKHYRVPDHWLSINTVDMHTGGEPLRIAISGFPQPVGETVLECRKYCKQNLDHLRTVLMFEPRGHADMYGCLLVPPNKNTDDPADFGIIFLHNEGYSTMCGHAIIAISTLAIQMNWIEVVEGENTIKIDAPCGRIVSFVKVESEEIKGVRFHCVPSFVVGLDRTIDVPGLGQVVYDLAYGGAFYAYVDLDKNELDLELTPDHYRQLIQQGMEIKRAVASSDDDIRHPYEDDLGFLYGTIFIGPPVDEKNDSRNVCIFAEGEVDRCPTGSGVSGRMAIHYAREQIKQGQTMLIESITGSLFEGSVVSEVEYGPFKAVIPQVAGTAHITGFHEFVIDPDDPMKDGFFLR